MHGRTFVGGNAALVGTHLYMYTRSRHRRPQALICSGSGRQGTQLLDGIDPPRIQTTRSDHLKWARVQTHTATNPLLLSVSQGQKPDGWQEKENRYEP